MSVQLRPYQNDIIEQVRGYMRAGRRSILVQSPTGSGKTLLTAHMLAAASAKGAECLFLVHRRELVKQSTIAFAQVGVRHGIMAAGFLEDPRHRVQIGSVQTVARRWQRMRRPKMVIWDECHHVAAATWSALREQFSDAYHVGLTATPERLDGEGLGKWFGDMIKGPAVTWLTENGYLAPYRLYAPATMNLDGVHTRMGDYAKGELNAAADKPTITGCAVREYQRRAPGKRALVFCVSVEHSIHVASEFRAAGIPAAHVDGDTPMDERDKSFADFAAGRLLVICNVEIASEGVDIPGTEVAILLRPTQSLGLHLQQVGRALRPAPGKDHALILDHAGNTLRHGLPDEEREWSLEGRAEAKDKAEKEPSVKICPKCFAAQFPRPVCKYCGHVFAVEAREVQQREGELEEISPEVLRRIRAREQSKCNSFDALVELGKERGYKRPFLWAKHVFNARQARAIVGR